jgi:Tfp pilus assembly protein PilV
MQEQVSDTRAASSEAGFTLAEALVAILVLVVGLMGVTNLMVISGASNVAANQGTAAASAASEALEALKSQPFTSAAMAPGGDVDADIAGPPPYFRDVDLPGVGRIHTRWQIVAVDAQTRFIRVRAQALGGSNSTASSLLGGARSRSEFTTFRSCTATTSGCP